MLAFINSYPNLGFPQAGESKQQLREVHLPFPLMETGDGGCWGDGQGWEWDGGGGQSSRCSSPWRCLFCLGGGTWPGTYEHSTRPKAPVDISALCSISADTRKEKTIVLFDHQNSRMETMILGQN